MKCTSILASFLASTISCVQAAAAAQSEDYSESVTVWSWPLSAPKPEPLAEIFYDVARGAKPLALAIDVSPSPHTYTPPQIPFTAEERVRVGLYDPKTSEWNGTVTLASSFDPIYQHRIYLHFDDDGNIYSAQFVAHSKPSWTRRQLKQLERWKASEKKAIESMQQGKYIKRKPYPEDLPEDLPNIIVDFITVTQGPRPILGQRVAHVTANGEPSEEEPEQKTFLQKYWWAIALFLVVQLISTAVPGEEGKEGAAKK